MTIQVIRDGEPSFEVEKFEGICPFCAREGRKSQLRPGISFKTAMYFAPYYDEEGKYHFHDGNMTTTDFGCSNGHRFDYRRKGYCSCGWSGGLNEIKLRRP